MNGERVQASVVVALTPHVDDVARRVYDYGRQTMRCSAFEVVVVDGGARPDVSAALDAHARAYPQTPLRHIAGSWPTRAACHNAGACAARSSLLIFFGHDLLPSPTLVRAHVDFHRALLEPAVGIGPALFSQALREDPFCRWLEDSGAGFGVPFRLAAHAWQRNFFCAANASLGRALFEKSGGFDERAQHELIDEHAFGLRLAALGVNTYFLPKALAWCSDRVRIADRADVLRRCGIAVRQFPPRDPCVRPWRHLIERPFADVAATAQRAGEAVAPDATTASRAAHYQALMDLAFAQGFRGS